MRLTALCVCGTLLAFSILSWTIADSDEGGPLGDQGFGPCVATLRPEGLCRQGQDDSLCPYLFSLPPLTFHLPKQLRELDKIVEELQKLKDNVDQLRKMCADCTVSQTERECERQRERHHDALNEGTDGHNDERNWLNERNPEECRTDRVKAENAMERDSDFDSEKRTSSKEEDRKKWEEERVSAKRVVKVNEKDVEAEKEGKTQTDGAKGKDKLRQEKVPTTGENERMVDMGRKSVVDKNNRETPTEINKEKERERKEKVDGERTLENGKERKVTTYIKNKEKTEESDHHVWRDERKETDKKTETAEDRGSDGIKMSEDRDEHTNKEREQHSEERRKEMEKGIKVERNNEKPKQTESIGRAEKEKTIKEGELEEDGETGQEIKTEGGKTVQSVQRDGDGELASSKSTEGTDFVSISPTDSIISLAPRHDSMDPNTAITITSSLPSPPLSSSTPHLITDVDQGTAITADGLPTQSTGLRTGGFSEQLSPVAEAGFRSTSKPTTRAAMSTLGGPGQQITSASTWSTFTTRASPGSGFKGRVSSTMETTTSTTPQQNSYTTTLPGAADHSRWAAKKNISSNTKTGMKPLPGRAPKPGERQKPAIKPEAGQKLKNPKNDRKPDRAPLPDKKTKYDQKQKPSQQKPTTDQKSKPGKDPKRVQSQKSDQKHPSEDLPTDQNLENIQTPKDERNQTTDRNQVQIQKPKSHQKSLLPVQRPTSQTVSATGSHIDPLTDQDPIEVPMIHRNSNPKDKKLVHPIKPNKPAQKQKPLKKTEGEERTKPDLRSTSNQNFTPVQEPEPERSATTSLTPKLKQNPSTESTESSDQSPFTGATTIKDSAPGQTPDHALIKPPDKKPKPSQKTNQKPKPGQASKPHQKHPKLITGQKTKPNVKPKTSQTNPGLQTSRPDQMPNPNTKSVPEGIPEAESSKTLQPRPPQKHRTPTRPTVMPGATPAEEPKPAVDLMPTSQTKTDLDPPKISGTSDSIQNSQTDKPLASGHVKEIAEVTPSPEDTEFRPKNQDHKMKTTTLGPKTSNRLKTGPFPHLHTHSEGFTVSPNRRIMSDLRPQTAGLPPSSPMTTRPNTIMRGILQSVVPSTSPGSTKTNPASYTDSSLQAQIHHNVQETAPTQTPDPHKAMVPVPSSIAPTASTTNPDLRSTTPATSGPVPLAAESSTPSARELRVKINQVAAFFNKSLSPNKRPPDRRPKELPEDSSRPDSKLPTLKPSKVTMLRRDCSDHLLRGETKSGVYLVTPDLRSRSFQVFCDMQLGGGGWTLLQRRQDGSVSFNRTWAEYRAGFGEIDGGEFWLGNTMIHLLTRDRDMVLRVELEDFGGVMEYAEYEHFRVASERMRYRLTVGGYSGTAGDALRFSKTYDHNNRAFTTPDRDHDRYPSGNCGAYYSSGWWFDACMAANLNGRYHVGRYKGVRDGIFWGTWHNISTEYYPTNYRQSFKAVRMMIRPKGFAS